MAASVVFTGANTGVKLAALYAANVVVVLSSVTGAYVAPAGTVTVRLVAVAAVTVARVAPKNTMLLAGEASKLVPVMVTVAPGLPV